MDANTRIQWLHKKIAMKSYPNAQRLAERFGISHRQAQRDLDYLKSKLAAPIAYDPKRKGFYYTESFNLPLLLSSDNDELYIKEILQADSGELEAEDSIIQMQIPYSALVEIPDKLTALELSRYIIAKKNNDRYLCEFHSIEKFIGVLFSLGGAFRIVEPVWLREKVIERANLALSSNGDEYFNKN